MCRWPNPKTPAPPAAPRSNIPALYFFKRLASASSSPRKCNRLRSAGKSTRSPSGRSISGLWAWRNFCPAFFSFSFRAMLPIATIAANSLSFATSASRCAAVCCCSPPCATFARSTTSSPFSSFSAFVRSFTGPVSRALLPQLFPEEHFPSAVAWASTIFQGAAILGPALGGLIYAFFRGPSAVYVLAVLMAIAAIICTLQIKTQAKPRAREPINFTTVSAGLRYIWREKLILGSISLDLFAVFLGGAVALLPVYAREILLTGPWGLGLLRTAPGIGAAAMAIFLAHRPIRRKVGLIMLWCVAGFGFFTILFGHLPQPRSFSDRAGFRRRDRHG